MRVTFQIHTYNMLKKRERQKNPNLTKWKRFIRIVLVIPKNERNTAIECNIYYEIESKRWFGVKICPSHSIIIYLWVEKMLTSFGLLFSGIRSVLELLSHTNPNPAQFSILFFFSFLSQCYIYTYFIYSNYIHPHFLYLFRYFVLLHKQWHDKRSKDEYTWLFDVSNLIKISKNGSAELK